MSDTDELASGLECMDCRASDFLLGDDARYISGHTLMVDGGSCPAI